VTLSLHNLFVRFFLDEEAATAIEYGLTASLISLALVTALCLMGGNLAGVFTKISYGLKGETPPETAGGSTG